MGPSTACRGREGRLAKGKDSRKAERVVGVEGGTKGAERERIAVKAEGTLSSDLIKIYFLETS